MSSPAVPGSRPTPAVLAVIAVGGMIGASARYGVARLLPARPGAFPWPTFWTNLSGSLALGVLFVVLIERRRGRHDGYTRPFLTTGILGAYTTFSTFAVEADILARDGH